MKTLTLICLILANLNAATYAGTDPFTQADKNREIAFATAHLINWGQQRNMARHHQAFPFEDRTAEDVDVAFLFSGAVQYFITKALPHEWRSTFQTFTIGVEVGQVARNFSIGARFEF